jgi:predicted component of type VI protein secretion system
MVINLKQLNQLIEIENKLASVKKYYNDFCVLSTMIEDFLQQRYKTNKVNWERIKAKRQIDKNYGRSKK